MALIEPLRAARVIHIDTAPIIYLVEQSPRYFELILPVAEAIAAGQIRAVSSYVTLLEVLVKPFERGAQVVAARYRAALLGEPNLEMVELGSEIAEEAARIRGQYRFTELRVVVLEHYAVH